MNGYAEVPTRSRLDGVIDKLVLVDASADASAHDRDFAEFVLRKVANAGNGADAQATVWCQYVESLPYRRERGEVLRDPKQTVGVKGPAVGGDCDDLVLALLAGLKSLEIPCQAEIMASDDGWGFHIRARVGLPPMNPKLWCVVDPVWKSEREWAMADLIDPRDNALAKHTKWYSPPKQKTLVGESSMLNSWKMPLAAIAAGLVLWKFRRSVFG